MRYQIVLKGGVMDGHTSYRETLPEFIEIPTENRSGGYHAIRYKHAGIIIGSQTFTYELVDDPMRSGAPVLPAPHTGAKGL